MLETARKRAELRRQAGFWKGKFDWACACGDVRGCLLQEELKHDRFGIRLQEEEGRFKGVLDLGEQARRCSGFEIEAWVVVPWSQLRGDGEAAKWLEGVKLADRDITSRDPVQLYRPAPGVERYRCEKCGARILLVERKRPGVVKIAAGLLRSEDGARPEDWIAWELDADHEDADPGLVDELRNSLQSWNEAMKAAVQTQETK
ncbi:hypothetical protein BDZ85DRAFT_257578 [Elsinoe ampelina]|uniref:Uncharacterized protein n=1 Tax=Elsinoe ampelina TaxID=302913 RepID=A0A6A6GIC5_9PEZI|nr:hypothetical protein BDZ85DRAFT_257578 [Elsinoe ampelina]